MLESFTSRPAPKLVFGPGAMGQLPACVRELGAASVFLVTDTGLVKAGHADRTISLLKEAGVRVHVYDHSHQNPTESDAEACRKAAQGLEIDCIVALGGGSSLDTAKACNFLLTNGGAMRDYHGYGKAQKPMLPLVAIPTTAGTGSECQSYALVSRDEGHEKMACGDPKACARIAILDPELTATQPRAVAIQTGLDALAHALESAVCTKRNALSSTYSEAAFRHLCQSIGSVVNGNPTDSDRANMQIGAALSGLAIENSMLGAAHAAANPLTARHNVIHGHAVALMLPHVMRFNAADESVRAIYDRFSTILGECAVTKRQLIDWVAELVRKSELPGFNGAVSDIEKLSNDASKQWTGQFNPRSLEVGDFRELYETAFANCENA